MRISLGVGYWPKDKSKATTQGHSFLYQLQYYLTISMNQNVISSQYAGEYLSRLLHCICALLACNTGTSC